MSYKKILLLFLTLSVHFSFAQNKQGNVWCFGDKAGLNFNTGSPIAFQSAFNFTMEGSSTISDEFGNLLFYTRGDSVWDRTNNFMPNGILKGHRSASQGVLITPVIGNCNQYYVFTVGANEQMAAPPGMWYSIVDMSLTGNGTVSCPAGDIIAGLHLTASPLKDSLDEKIISVMLPNGIDYWVIVKTWSTNTYYSFLVTAAGINPVPQQSTAGTGNENIGYMKNTKDGKCIANATSGYIELLDFNPVTGVVSNARKISTISDPFYGVSFSCNDSIIYATYYSSLDFTSKLVQYQRFAPNIPATETTVATMSNMGSLQLAPDGKIYSAESSQNAVSVINNPNSVALPDYVSNAIPLTAGTSALVGTPNFFHGYERNFCSSVNLTKNYFVCQDDSVTIGFPEISSCHSYEWFPASGLDNALTAFPKVSPSVSTTYTIVITTINCNSYTDTVRVNVNPKPSISFSGNTSICSGSNTTITASGATYYLWNTGNTNSVITVTPSVNNSYTVIATDNSGCINAAQITITVTPTPVLSASNDTSICEGDNITLTVTGGGTYIWNTGDVTPSINVSPTSGTTYTVTSANGSCRDTAAIINIGVMALPTADAGLDETICAGQTVTLNASGGTRYVWNTGETTSAIIPHPPVTTTYTVIAFNGNCPDIDTVKVTVNIPPTANAGNDTIIISGDTITLTGTGGGSYIWSTGETTSTIKHQPTITTTYYLTVTDAAGCTSIDSVTITVEIICEDIFIATAFSPNNDGQNDILKIEGNCIQEITLTIYNRWGEIVFQTNDTSPGRSGWDGTNGSASVTGDSGKIMDADVFAYQLTATLLNSEIISKKGTISLIR